MQLHSVLIEKFKRIESIELPLADLNILVGSNGSGKSSILQALHLASCLMRQADRIRPNSTSMVRVRDLDYLPSDQYWRLGHEADWGNKSTTPSSRVSFRFEDAANSKVTSILEMRSARNAGISVQGELPEIVRNQFRGDAVFFSGFIPGISGIPNVEPKNSKRVVLKACSFGDSNVYLRNALHLLPSSDITQIEDWLEPLLGKIKLKVRFDDSTDVEISSEAEINGLTVPLELLGTGYLQLIQIFCYVLLFKPKILLIDEPDIHLHPIVQERLSHILVGIAREKSIKIILSTHSPFVLRGAPVDTNVFWLSNGQKKEESREAIELALGWGAFGKKVLIISEDRKNDLLKEIISQWPEIERVVAILPGSGYKHLPSPQAVRELRLLLGGKYKFLIHRDRDSLTDDEVDNLKNTYNDDGIRLWLTEQSDLEAEFCDPVFVSALTGVPIPTCETWLAEILDDHQVPIQDQFASQRSAVNQELYKAGGGPKNDEVWAVFQQLPLKGAKGKFVFGKLKNKVPSNAFSEAKIQNASGYPERAVTLRATLEELLA